MKQRIIFSMAICSLILILGLNWSCDGTIDTHENYITQLISDNWKFRDPSDTNWLDASVPGCVHSDLLKNNLIKDPYYRTNANDMEWIDTIDWKYETKFNVSEDFLSKENINLAFKCVDTYADIYLNDSLVLTTDNYFLEWKVDVKGILQSGQNKLLVQFHNAIDEGLKRLDNSTHPMKNLPSGEFLTGALNEKKLNAFTRKPGYQFGWDWTHRFISVGLREPVFIEAWDQARIQNVQIIQDKVSKESAELSTFSEVISNQPAQATLEVINSENNQVLATKQVDLEQGLNKISVPVKIDNPKLWWTNGLGDPHLYQLDFKLTIDNKLVSTLNERIGIRTIRLVREPDSPGTTFYFELNGVPVFMKGSNYIPGDNFLDRVTEEKYRKTIQYSRDANMNMLRVWGGGIYEKDLFYDLCDENGILVWQDFMFGGGIYPAEGRYLESVKQEVGQVARRLRNHACLALWCGNNEVYEALDHWGWDKEFTKDEFKKIWDDYYKLFNNAIPEVLKQHDPTRDYWPSSPLSDWDKASQWDGFSGDLHYWEIWFFNAPFEKTNIRHGRFNSEFGFQSFPEMKTIKKFSVEEDWAIDSKVMAHRQKSYVGNKQIKTYMEMYYRYPSNFENFVYLSQVLQAFGIKKCVEIQRKKMPVCMGSLYWQLNDCWPAISWSSLDYYQNWKALHYFIREANKPVIVVPEVWDDSVNVHVVSDKLESINATLEMALMDFSGKKLWNEKKQIEIGANNSESHFSMPESDFIGENKKPTLLMHAQIRDEQGTVLDDGILYFVKQKDLELPEEVLDIGVEPDGKDYSITIKSDQLCKNIYLSLSKGEGFFTDNYFDILPGETKKVILKGHNLTSLDKKDINYITLRQGME